MSELYPPIEPYNTGMLKVDDTHTLYYEEVGNPEGTPVVFLHGGPGGGCIDDYRRYFNPKKWRVVLFDQRGCGRSLPFSELKDNTTWHSVEDIEKLRGMLGIEKWSVFGGSWGSTLALAYSITHPSSVEALFLRGIFMVRPKEIKWFYQEGASRIFPDAWEKYVAPIPLEERGDFVDAFHKRLTSDNPETRKEAAVAWATWEGSTSKLIPSKRMAESYGDDHFADAFARIECHYFFHNCWFESNTWILDNIDKIKHIPAFIVHGRYDVVCCVENAWELHKAWPGSELKIVEDAGHSLSEEGITNWIIGKTDSF